MNFWPLEEVRTPGRQMHTCRPPDSIQVVGLIHRCEFCGQFFERVLTSITNDFDTSVYAYGWKRLSDRKARRLLRRKS